MIKILNLYAGIGGNRKLWGGDIMVTAVEINEEVAKVYKDNFPNDNVIVADAHQYLLDHYAEYDFIWSSPPCQTHSRMNKATRHKLSRYPDMSLYQEIIFLQHFFRGVYVVENVIPYYDALIKPVANLDRHLFWSNFRISDFSVEKPRDFLHARKQEMMDWIGIHFEKNIYLGNNHCEVQILRNCVHPSLGKHIFDCAFNKVQVTLKEVSL